jgi:osmoprotectant transport system substrate-binding protein
MSPDIEIPPANRQTLHRERNHPMKRQHKALALLVVAALAVAACGGDDDDDTATSGNGGEGGSEQPADGPAIKIGAQDFGESAILSSIYDQALDDAGFNSDVAEVGGFRDLLFAAFESGDVNLAPEYVASELNFLQAGAATSDVDESLGKLQPLLAEKGLTALDPSEAVDNNVFVMTKDKSEELGITSLSDLAEKGADLKLGAPQDCEENAFCLPGLKEVYGLDMSSNFTPLDAGVIATSLNEDAIDVAVLFSTDGKLADEDWVVLDDDKNLAAADNIVPVLTKELVDSYGEDLTSVLNDISAALTTDDLIEMNKRYDIDHDDPEDIAADWLSDNKIGE